MSNPMDSSSGTYGLQPPPSPIPRDGGHPPVAYVASHSYAVSPIGELQTRAYQLDYLLNQQFGSENSFGPPEITPDDISFDHSSDCIGTGSYGTVYRAKCRGHEVAAKIPHQQKIADADLKSFQEEVKLMSKLNHQNLIRLMGACTVPGSLQIVTERCAIDLARLLDDPSYDGSLYDRLKIARDTARGMAWLHDVSKIIHGDLKPANLLIDDKNQVKITDFGFSQIKKDYPIEGAAKGSLIWMAPEKMQRQKITEKVDVFSFGIILWEMITRKKPYEHHHDPTSFCKAVCFAKERPPMTAVIPVPLQKLIQACWEDNPAQRCSFAEILYRLNAALVDCVIELPYAGVFWQNKFLHRESFESVDWSAFKKALNEELGNYEESFYDWLKTYLVETTKEGGKEQEVVTMTKFDKVSKWFGPFFLAETGTAIINEVSHLSIQPWFHGDITRETANTCLADKGRGTFLVRLSSNDPLNIPFALSLPKNNHFQMQRTSAGLLVQKEVYPSLEYFVQKNSNTLKVPCTKEFSHDYSQAANFNNTLDS